MNISFIVCAAGKGERAGFGKNKLLAPLFGAPALYHTLSGINKLIPILAENGDALSELIIAASSADMAEITAICAPFGGKVIAGGNTRTESVYNCLKQVTGEIVVIQDGARPFTLSRQYSDCIDCVKKYKSAVVAAPATDTTIIVKDGWAADIPERKDVFSVQTPQGFFTKDIKWAYEKAIADGGVYTDDGSVYSRYISPVRICPCGTAANRKLTFKEDFDNPKTLDLPASENSRVGFGVDVHAFGRQADFVTLCGVRVPCDCGLVAHSDGDVAIHAVMDAVLSAAGLKDIGHYFPDSDLKYKNADSTRLLKEVINIIEQKGLKVSGLSVAIQAEKPRLSPYIDKMVSNLASLTHTDGGNISITAGTCEGLGFVGEKRGICVYCAAALNNLR